ncbi:hypothetical protein QYF61_003935 [Mycteria americana]|uniref:Uncharacterized protein n=1 Tax=Mycteria americana TaxID=33587 RepID=A0AAN7SCN5_MYCAM|nr:hypothetical protein QYF61_003935 [Mycteria americana]
MLTAVVPKKKESKEVSVAKPKNCADLVTVMSIYSCAAERHASAFKKSTLSVEPVHKMECQQY